MLAYSEAHFSLKHAVRILGLGDQSLIPIPVNSNYRMDVRVLNKTIQILAAKLSKEPDIEVCHQPDLGLLCIRINPKNFSQDRLDHLQRFIYERIKKDGKRSISMTKFGDNIVLRLVAISSSVTSKALMETIEAIRQIVNGFSLGKNHK